MTETLEFAIQQAQKELNAVAACITQADYLPVVIDGLQGTEDPDLVDLLELAKSANRFRNKLGILLVNMEAREKQKQKSKTEAA